MKTKYSKQCYNTKLALLINTHIQDIVTIKLKVHP